MTSLASFIATSVSTTSCATSSRWRTPKEKQKKVHGVLTDYNLSSWTTGINPDYTKILQQQTRTLPYMALELLKGTSPLHLYRHNIKSFFYIMLLMVAHHMIGIPKKGKRQQVVLQKLTRLPYQRWFNQQDYDTLGSLKETFFLDKKAIELSPVFKDFLPWLQVLQCYFSRGFKLEPSIVPNLPGWAGAVSTVGIKPSTARFNNKTFRGHITYSTVVKSAHFLAGELKGLIVHYPQSPPIPVGSTSASKAHADDD